ncbi:MAG: hypothetical protein ACK492_04460 [Chitinophagaceae bacterium]|jgi:hypothetical protein
MKKIIITLFTAFQSLIGLAQERDTIITLPEVRITAASAVTTSVYSSFRRAFPEAENLRWYKYDRDYLAKFFMKDMDHNALFRKNGVMKYDISYGYQQHLPEAIKDDVLKAYDNYKIIRAINVKAYERDIWVIKLEGERKYLTVRIEDGEMDEVESFFKSDQP